MKTTTQLFLSTAAGFLLLANAHAGVMAVDVPRISNGSTGFIGVTESAGQPKRMAMNQRWGSNATSAIPTGAGEASTMVDGRPNLDPNVAAVNGQVGMESNNTRTMGASAGVSAARSEPASYTNPSWGTPK